MTYTANFIRPLIENIDAVHYTQMARVLRVAEEYAVRLLSSKHTDEEAKEIAQSLVEEYPEHGFVIDSDEAKKIGLKVQNPLPELDTIFDALIPELNKGLTLVGQFKEIIDETQTLPTDSETGLTNEEARNAERGGDSDSNVEGK